MWHEDFDGLPEETFLVKLDPLLEGLKERLYTETYTAEVAVGNLSQEWAEKLGLSTDVLVGAGTFDAHAGALGGEIEAFTLSKVMGTSTCDMLVAPIEEAGDKLVKGICGQVDGSIVPGMLGLEAGQSAWYDAEEARVQQAESSFSNAEAWRTEQLTFENEQFGSVAIILERYFDLEVTFGDSNMENCYYTGKFNEPKLEELLDVWRFMFDWDIRQEGTRIIFEGEGCN